MSQNLLQVTDLSKAYGNHYAVKDVSFALEKNSSTALIGPNGAGKTTTLSMLAGLLNPSSGNITIHGIDKPDMRKDIGFLPQYPQFYSWLSAIEYTEMAARLNGVETKKARELADKTLDFVGLGESKKKKTGTFSGGMKQRLGLAQAIVHKPSLLLLDEPISALDPLGRREILNLLKELQQTTTILYSTHILNDAEEMTDQLLFMQKGRLVEVGSLKSIREKYANSSYLLHFVSSEEASRYENLYNGEITRNKDVVTIPITENHPSMQQVLSSLTMQNWDILKVEKSSASLEEIFLQVVNKG